MPKRRYTVTVHEDRPKGCGCWGWALIILFALYLIGSLSR